MKSAFNDNKAGMGGLDKERIEKIIQANTSSNFDNHSKKQNQRIADRAYRNQQILDSLSEIQIEEAEKEMDDFVDSIESERDLNSIKVHIDMDAFFAAVEMRNKPELRVIPIAVGSDNMLSTSNYIARRYGIRSAMPGFIAKKLCPELTIVRNSYGLYKKESDVVAAIFKEYDPHVRMGSLDEACLDLTDFVANRTEPVKLKRIRYLNNKESCICRLPLLKENEEPPENAKVETKRCEKCDKEQHAVIDFKEFGLGVEEVVNEIRFQVEQATGLTCSAGIACNWMLSKICSDMNKPNGQFRLPSEKQAILDFMRELPIRKVSGIGAVTEALLKSLDINKCQDLYNKRGILKLLFSEQSAHWFLYIVRGIYSSSWVNSEKDRGRKSISTERTFTPQKCVGTMLLIIKELCQELIDSISESPRIEGARAATLKIKFATFDVITRCQTVDYVINSVENFFPIMERLFRKEIKANLAIRLIGVRLSRLIRKGDESTKGGLGGQQITLMNFVRRPNNGLVKKESTNKEVEIIELDSGTSDDDDSNSRFSTNLADDIFNEMDFQPCTSQDPFHRKALPEDLESRNHENKRTFEYLNEDNFNSTIEDEMTDNQEKFPRNNVEKKQCDESPDIICLDSPKFNKIKVASDASISSTRNTEYKSTKIQQKNKPTTKSLGKKRPKRIFNEKISKNSLLTHYFSVNS